MPEADVVELVEKERIREVLYRYCRAVDRGDLELLKSCYHPDAHDDHGFYAGNAWEFADYVIPRLAELDFSIHSLSNILIDLRGGQAFVESQWSVIHRVRRWLALTDMWHQGRYLDLFEKRSGEWKIARRISVVDADRWLDGVDLAALAPKDSPYRSVTGRRGKDDLVYQGFQLAAAPKRTTRPMDRLWLPIRLILRLPRLFLRRGRRAVPGERPHIA